MFSPKIYGCGVARRCHGKLGGIAENLRRQFPLMPRYRPLGVKCRAREYIV
jgi:hypothetical protein